MDIMESPNSYVEILTPYVVIPCSVVVHSWERTLYGNIAILIRLATVEEKKARNRWPEYRK